jgi:hypothetical protein
MEFQVLSIHGVPRSGTSWLGQVFDSHPDVAYRHQPLFAYRFKDRLNLQSTRQDVRRFLDELYQVEDDDFILDASRREKAPDFWAKAIKTSPSPLMVMKEVRYHHLLPLLLESVPGMKIIGIVRHPCAVINSWLQAPKEFRAGWDELAEWRYAPKKNEGRIEEFNGFAKWTEVAGLFLRLEREYPDNFILTRYECLMADAEREIGRLFTFAGLPPHPQAQEFIRMSRSRHDSDPYSVFKDPATRDRWPAELNPAIAAAILAETRGSELERFTQ